MELATASNQITIFYIKNSIRAKKTLAFCKTAGLPIREIDMSKTKLTGTLIKELSTHLNIPLKELINTKHSKYIEFYGDAVFNEVDIIKIIQKHPEVMKQPIVLRGKQFVLIETPTDVLKLTALKTD